MTDQRRSGVAMKATDYGYHPAASLFPLLDETGADFAELVAPFAEGHAYRAIELSDNGLLVADVLPSTAAGYWYVGTIVRDEQIYVWRPLLKAFVGVGLLAMGWPAGLLPNWKGRGSASYAACPFEPQRAERTSDAEYVYFIEGANLIKIGVARWPSARMAILQRSSPVRLRLLGFMAGGQARERELHRLFAADRVWGEWFKPSTGLDQTIRDARVDIPVPEVRYGA